MSKKDKKPDLVAWDEERGYYSRELTYGSNIGAPKISLENTDSWRRAKVLDVNTQFKVRYEELRAKAAELMDEYNWNDLIYTRVSYNFQPIIGHLYHLYSRPDDTLFLSIIEPSSWKMNYVGSFKLDSSNKWIKV